MKHHSRNRLFKRWFRNYADDSFIHIENKITSSDLDIEYLISAIVHEDNKQLESLKIDMQKMSDELSSYK